MPSPRRRRLKKALRAAHVRAKRVVETVVEAVETVVEAVVPAKAPEAPAAKAPEAPAAKEVGKHKASKKSN